MALKWSLAIGAVLFALSCIFPGGSLPRINHPTLGDVVATQYLTGTIIAVDTANDTCSVQGTWGGADNIPIFYHCNPDAEIRDNGALVGGAAAFGLDDEVIVLMQRDVTGQINPLYVVGFVDGIHQCQPKYLVMVRYRWWGSQVGSLIVLDISDPVSPVEVGIVTSSSLFEAIGVDTRNNRAYVGAQKFVVLDLANPTAPEIVNVVGAADDFIAPVASPAGGDYIFVDSITGGVYVFNNDGNIVYVHAVGLSEEVIAGRLNTGYFVEGPGAGVGDSVKTITPGLVSTIFTFVGPNDNYALAASNSWLYAFANNGTPDQNFYIWNIADTPVFYQQIPINTIHLMEKPKMAATESHMVAVNRLGQGMYVFNHISVPVLVSQQDPIPGGSIEGICIVGNYVYALFFGGQIAVVDISIDGNPVLVNMIGSDASATYNYGGIAPLR